MAQINTEFTFQDKITPGLKTVQNEVEKTSAVFNDMTMKLLSVDAAIRVFSEIKTQFNKVSMAVNQCVAAYQYQNEQELKLETIMRKRMNATNEEIQSIKNLAAAQQRLGIYGDEMILQGAQELASFTTNKEAIETLIPAMNNLIAQQYGYNASGMDFQHTADMMGKVLSGQVGALSRIGYIFSEDEKKMLKTGNEMQRAATLAKIITDNVGEMNQAMSGTRMGNIQSMSMTLGDLKEKVGEAMMPFVQFFRMLSMRANVKFHENVLQALDYIKNNADVVLTILASITTAVGLLTIKIIALKWQMITAWVAAYAPIVLTAGAITLVISAVASLFFMSNKIFPAIGSLIGGLVGIFFYLGRQIKETVGGAIEIVYKAFMSMFDLIWSGLEKIASSSLFVKIFGTSFADNIREMRNLMKNEADLDLGWGNTKGFSESFESGAKIGYQKGEDLARWSPTAQWGEMLMSRFGGVSEKVEEGIKNALPISGGALDVSDKNMIALTEDYKKLLSKRATERFNLQYRSITPSLNIDNINVQSPADENSLIHKLTNGLAEVSNSDLRTA